MLVLFSFSPKKTENVCDKPLKESPTFRKELTAFLARLSRLKFLRQPWVPGLLHVSVCGLCYNALLQCIYICLYTHLYLYLTSADNFTKHEGGYHHGDCKYGDLVWIWSRGHFRTQRTCSCGEGTAKNSGSKRFWSQCKVYGRMVRFYVFLFSHLGS